MLLGICIVLGACSTTCPKRVDNHTVTVVSDSSTLATMDAAMKAETRVLPEETESYGKVYHLFLTQEAVFGAGALTPYVRQLILESKTPTDQVPSLICQYFCSSSGMPSHRYKCAWADPNQTDEVFHCELTVDTCQEAQAKSGL